MIDKDYIDKNLPLPYYVQLKNILLDKINSGEFTDGRLSSEHELSRKYDITVTTVRKTLSELKNEGRIHKVKGLGTFINKPKIEIDFSKYLSLGRILKQKGIKEDINVLNKKVVDFNKKNFLKPIYKNMPPLQMALCRNVFIYFKNEVQEWIIEQVSSLIVPGGYFIIGSAEFINKPERFKLERQIPSVYLKLP